VKKNISEVEGDAFFDPFLALEMKNALGELVARKAELLNTVEHLDGYFKWLGEFTRPFSVFCKQVGKGYRSSKDGMEFKGIGNCLCCGQSRVRKRQLINMMPLVSGKGKDVMVILPMSDEFQKIL